MMPNLYLGVAGGFAITALVFMWVIVRRVGRKSQVVPETGDLWEGRAFRCPVCGAPMDEGYVLGGRGLIWSRRGQAKRWTFAHIGEALDNTLSLSLSPAVNLAWRCEPCRMLLVDHDKMVRPNKAAGRMSRRTSP